MEAVNAKDAPLLRLKYVPSISHDFFRTLGKCLRKPIAGSTRCLK
jgi:hypothetical protein